MNAKSKDTTREEPILGWTYPNSVHAVAPHIGHFLNAQNQVAGIGALYAERCLERRTDAVRSSIETANEMLGAQGDPSAAMSAYQRWQTQNLDRAAEDMSDWVAFVRSCADCFTSEEIAAEAEVVGAGGKAKRKDRLPTRIPV